MMTLNLPYGHPTPTGVCHTLYLPFALRLWLFRFVVASHRVGLVLVVVKVKISTRGRLLLVKGISLGFTQKVPRTSASSEPWERLQGGGRAAARWAGSK